MALTISSGYHICLGGFHRAKNLIIVIGILMKLTGLKEILEVLEMYGPAQIEGNCVVKE